MKKAFMSIAMLGTLGGIFLGFVCFMSDLPMGIKDFIYPSLIVFTLVMGFLGLKDLESQNRGK